MTRLKHLTRDGHAAAIRFTLLKHQVQVRVIRVSIELNRVSICDVVGQKHVLELYDSVGTRAERVRLPASFDIDNVFLEVNMVCIGRQESFACRCRRKDALTLDKLHIHVKLELLREHELEVAELFERNVTAEEEVQLVVLEHAAYILSLCVSEHEQFLAHELAMDSHRRVEGQVSLRLINKVALRVQSCEPEAFLAVLIDWILE